MQNQAFYMTGLNKMEAREIPMPSVNSDQVIIKIEYVGICGSDSHYLEFGRIGSYVVEGDFILGHECAGTIVEVGSQVTSLKVGDRVALEPGVTCGRCYFCKSGKYNLCPDVQFLATPPYNGCLMNYMAFPAHMCFKLPQNVSTREGALVEPLSVGMHAANQGHVRTGDNVVILGSGCIGLVTLMSCKASGAGKVTVVDIMPKRLEFAKKLGADFTVDSSKEDIIQFAKNLNDGAGPDVVIETAGSEITIQQSPYLVRRGGRIVLVGLAAKDRIPFDFSQVMWKEASVSTVFRYRNIYPSAIEAIASGAIKVAGIITHEFGFDEIPKAFEYASKNKNEVVKAVIKL